ncbi:acyl-CoA-like ligand-binding transcription factor [Actinomadura violacea]|uniref:TetR family transcriptional regulator n=1 Tax=Actinomadura violacea TaxID=2819934 RepID=A0ABS3S3B0_9ACTN|nr:TetR family transcriptional regulator [Actinomadura violacea]MBO2463477.1 TetR family transcriptional regulator [Actinomadura violacea]
MAIDRAQEDRPQSGLREWKKQATREALTLAAVRLAVERGLENVRVEDIAAEVRVSTRTFNNYFTSKYEALAARHVDRMRRSARELRERPGDEPLWEAITKAVLAPLAGSDQAHGTPDPQTLAGIRLIAAEPALQAETLRIGMAAGNEFTAAVADRTGTDADRDLFPRLVAATVTAAVHVATDRWLRSDPPAPLTELLREALRQLAAGLPMPPADTPR